MRRPSVVVTGLWLALCVLFPPESLPWGEQAHILITEKAVGMLPDEMRPLFEANREELARLSNVPDKEWKADPELKYRSAWHFLDIDLFDYGYPFDKFPRDREEAEKLYEEHGKEAGYLPWTIEDFYNDLVEAMREGDRAAIIENAGLISHFAGDATMPLHSTRNYNGQYSGNLYYRVEWNAPEYIDKGVHQRFELGLIREYLAKYTDETMASQRDLVHIDAVLDHAFDVIVDSKWHVDHIVYFDKVIGQELGLTGDLESFKSKRAEFYAMLDRHVGWLAKERLEKGAVLLASLWYSAWKEAGEPPF